MTEHAPTPFECKGKYVFSGRDCIAVCDTDNATDARMEANAAHIVKAVNSLDDLIEALQEAREYFDNRSDADCDQDGYIPNEEMKLLSVIDTALAKAGVK